jgi:hypothetical protein
MISNQMIGSLGAVLSIALGLFGLIFPSSAAKLVAVQPLGRLGTSEIRATYGGLFIGLGAACLYLQHPIAYFVGGAAWLGAAVGRLISVLIDSSYSSKNFGGICLEGFIGSALAYAAISSLKALP